MLLKPVPSGIPKAKRAAIPWYVFALSAALVLFVGLAGFGYIARFNAQLKAEIQKKLLAVANLKADEIKLWRDERFSDMLIASKSQRMANSIEKFLEDPNDLEAKEIVPDMMRRLSQSYGYHMALFRPDGTLAFAYPETPGPAGAGFRGRLIQEALQTQKITFGDFHFETEQGQVRLGFFVPILSPENGHPPVAVLSYQIDPERFLYPMLRSWPIPSRTAEALLARQEDGDVLFLNPLRYKEDAALSFKVPLTGEAIAARAFRGEKNVFEGVDYRGVPVLAVARSVPETPWLMVAKVDAAEVYEPVRNFNALAVGALSVIVLVLVAFLLFFWRSQSLEFYRREYRFAVEREALTKHFDYLLKHANDIILLFDDTQTVCQANEKALVSYGYSREEFLGLRFSDLFRSDQAALADSVFQKARDHDGQVLEAENVRKDGGEFSAEISLRVIHVEDKVYGQAIIRDITLRKKMEMALRSTNQQLEATNQQLRAHEQQLQAANQQLRANEQQLQAANQQLRANEQQLQAANQQLRANEQQLQAANQQLGAGEEQLRRNEARYRELVDRINSAVAVYAAADGGEDFVFKDFNLAGAKIEKIDRASVLGKKVTDVFPGIRDFGLMDVLRRVWKTGTPESYPARLYKDNRISGYRQNFVYRLPDGEVVAVYDDVTAMMKTEEDLRQRVHELEVFYRSSMGREERILELKEKVRELEEALKKK